jgi:putative endonuclease
MPQQGILTMEHTYYTYIMASVSGTLYIGITNSIEVRVRQHKLGELEGFSAQYKCNRLVYFERYGEVGMAIGREKQLKGWRRSKKITLIESMNPRWKDLSESWGREMLFKNQRIDEAEKP